MGSDNVSRLAGPSCVNRGYFYSMSHYQIWTLRYGLTHDLKLRACIVNFRTQESDVDFLVDEVMRLGAAP